MEGLTVKKVFCLFLATVTLFLCACGGTAAPEKTPNPTPAQTIAPTPEPIAEPTPEPSVEPKPDRNGFDEASNTEYSFGGLSFQIPSYYEAPEPEESSKGEQITLRESGKEIGGILCFNVDYDKGLSAEAFRGVQLELAEYVSDSFEVKIRNTQELTMGECPALEAEYEKEGYDGSFVLFLGPKLKAISVMISIYPNDAEYDYLPDFERILNSAVIATEISSDGVTPAFKAQMDSYEEFIDEYIDFMQSYLSSGDIMSMLGKYTSMMNKYLEIMDALDEIEDSELSTADYMYYLEVSTRITQKLVKILG